MLIYCRKKHIICITFGKRLKAANIIFFQSRFSNNFLKRSHYQLPPMARFWDIKRGVIADCHQCNGEVFGHFFKRGVIADCHWWRQMSRFSDNNFLKDDSLPIVTNGKVFGQQLFKRGVIADCHQWRQMSRFSDNSFLKEDLLPMATDGEVFGQ